MKTYNDLYLETRKTLKAGGVEDFNLEARLIISAVGEKTKEEFVRDLKLYALGNTEGKVRELTERRLTGEPLAYVLGEWEFMGHPFKVEPGVLIPRPDTELLCELALRLLRARGSEGARVLDLCCGTGCIGISIAAAAADARVVMVDNSLKALRVARANALRNNVTRNSTVIEADALKQPPMLLGRFDIIVSNPPYVPTGEIPTLESTVKDFEPSEALDGGADGLDFYRAIIPAWSKILKEDGCLLFECGEGQAEEVEKMLTAAGFRAVASYEDAAGTKRVVAGKL